MTTATKTDSAALAVAAPSQQFDLSPQTFEQALIFSNYLADSDLVPKDFKGKPGNCLVAMQWGAELGLKPLQSLQNLAVINGRPALWGDAVIAIVRSSAVCEFIIETDDGHTATCRVKRRSEPEQARTFSMDDAKAAGLSGKQGPWSQYPKRMRQMRARAFALRDVFPDVLRGLPVAEEVMYTPTERFMGNADVVGAPPPPPSTPQTWPADAFAARLPKWQKAINEGSTHDQIIQFARTKGTLTPDQEATIRALKPQGAGAPTFEQVEQKLRAAADEDDLNVAANLIGAITDPAQQAELNALYQTRLDEMSTI